MQHGRGLLKSQARRGAALVEFALVAPVLFLLVFGLIEFSRMAMVYHVITDAAREGSRKGTLPGATAADVTAQVDHILAGGHVSGTTVTITPSNLSTLNAGDAVRVDVSVPYNRVSWLPAPMFLGSRRLTSESVMYREGK